MAVAPLTLTAVREQFVDMSTPFMQTGLGFIMRKDVSAEESTFSLLSPFSTHTWVGLLIASLLTALCIFLVSRSASRCLRCASPQRALRCASACISHSELEWCRLLQDQSQRVD